VVRIVRATTDRLRNDWHDEHDLVVAATAVLQSLSTIDLGPVILYLPERLPSAGAGLLHAREAARVEGLRAHLDRHGGGPTSEAG